MISGGFLRNTRIRLVLAIAIGSIVLYAITAGASHVLRFMSNDGVPDVAGRANEHALLARLEQGDDRDAVIAFLGSTHTDWRPGAAWKGPHPSPWFVHYPNLSTIPPCTSDCTTKLQAEFPVKASLCGQLGDMITIAFRASGRVASWRRERIFGSDC